LTSIDYSLPVASAQVKSCLLLAGLAADGPVRLHEPGPSRDHTERMLSYMGAQIKTTRDQDGPGSSVTLLPISASPRPLHLQLPGDFSSAAFLIVAALIAPGSQIVLENVGLNPTRTGLLDVLNEMGADIQIIQVREQAGEPCGDLRVRHSQLQAGRVSGERVVRMIDEFPAFAVAACYAEGSSLVCDASELRLKESDRIGALAQELRRLGIEIQEAADGFTISGRREVSGGKVSPHKDHRLAMALAVAGLAGKGPIQVQEAEIIAESYPEFTQVLIELGADIRLEEASHAG
jgi:3-phosphoshikimate 1-carboxyvinyltransferase